MDANKNDFCGVELINHNGIMPSDIGKIANISYGGDATKEQKLIKIFKHCIAQGHESILEFATFCFKINCSKSCSHQIVRHRSPYNQKSDRRTALNTSDSDLSALKKLINGSIDINDGNSKHISEIIDQFIKGLQMTINKVNSINISEEEKSQIIKLIKPTGSPTELYGSYNLRQLRHFLALRLCNHAEYEIQLIAQYIAKLIASIDPLFLYKLKNERVCNMQTPCAGCLVCYLST